MAQVVKIGNATVELTRGDITKIAVDAIVNAANSSLAGGGGVDGAIHRVGGTSIMEECRKIGHCATGGAVVTRAGRLPAAHVIHAVAPRYSGSEDDEVALRRAYQSSLQLAAQIGARSISFPSLGTGAYGYPIDEASGIAVQTVFEHLKRYDGFDRVVFVVFSDPDYHMYVKTLQALLTD